MYKRDHIQGAIRNHGIIFFVVVCLLLFGIWSLPNLNKDEFPQFTIRQAVVAAIYPGANAQEVEEQVTKPLEKFLFTYPEINKKTTYSVTEDGIVYIFADLRVDVERKDEVWSKVKAGLNLFQKTSLPKGVLQIVVVDDFGNTSSVLLAVESPERSPRELEQYSNLLCERLRTIPSMGNIRLLGGQKEQIAITIDVDRLSAYGINQTTLLAQLGLQGLRSISSDINSSSGTELLQVSIPYSNEYEIGEQVIFTDLSNGTSLKLKDIATIERKYGEDKKYVQYYEQSDAKPCLIISMEMYPGNNIVAFGNEVDKVLADARRVLPPDLQFHRITDQPKVVNHSVMSFLGDLLMSILVVIAVMLMLFPLRTALVASTGVPVCTAICLGLMYLTGIELNTVTLAALIVVLGMIVDDSVIVIDGYTEMLEKGYSRYYSATQSTKQLFIPMTIATCSISGMFFPMTKIITGPLGEFVQLFPWAVLFALTASIFYAVWVIPYMSMSFVRLRDPKKLNMFERGQNRFFDWLQRAYHSLLTVCFRFPWLTILFAILMVGLGGFLFTRLNVQMMPKAERECFAVEIHLAEGSTTEQTAYIADSLARALQTDERIVSITSFIGQSSPRFHATYQPQMAKPSYAQFIVNTISSDATAQILQQYTPLYENAFPNAYIRFKQMDYQAVKNPIEIRLQGSDLELMNQYAERIKNELSTLDELTWVHSDYDEIMPTLRIDLLPEESSRLGITQTMLSLYLSEVTNGQQITSVWEKDYNIPVMLYTPYDTCNLQNILIPTAIPELWVPLRQVATITPEWHHSSIGHRNNIRTITVGADLVGNASAPAVMKMITPKLKPIKEDIAARNEDISISYGGLGAVNDAVIPELMLSLISALLVMFALLLIHFSNVKIAMLSLSMSILCIFGTCLGLYIFGLDYSITALLGMVSLIGIIVRNAIIMYEYAEELRKHKHHSAKQAAFEAGLRRMRPIFLTSATTALGVIPMIIAHTGLWMPMGVVICFGTIFTLPLVITVLPVVYWKVYQEKTPKVKPQTIVAKASAIILLLFSATMVNGQELTLDSCLTLALRNNAQVVNSDLEIKKAEEQKKQVVTKFFPQISASAFGYYSLHPILEIDAQDVIGSINQTAARDLLNTIYQNYGVALGMNGSFSAFQRGVVAGVTALQPVYMGGQIVNGTRLAQLGIEAAELQKELQIRDLLIDVEECYWLSISLAAKQQTIDAYSALLDTLQTNLQSAISAGLSTQSDMLKLQMKQNELQAKQLQLLNAIQLAKQALCQSIGIDYSDSIQLADSISTDGSLEYSQSANTERTERKLLELKIKSEQLQKKMEIGKALPQVAVGAGYSYSNLLFDRNTTNGAVFATVQIPLTQWWETAHKIKSANYSIEQAQNDYNYLNQRMELQELQLSQAIAEAKQKISIAQTSHAQAKEHLRISQSNFDAGLIPLSELLEAQSLVFQADNDLQDAIIAHRMAEVRLNRIR